MRSPLSYLGGKSRLAAQIVKQIPADHTCYVEPFCGACWVAGGKTTSRTFGTSTTAPSKLNMLNAEDHLLEVHWRFRRVVIEHLDALECIRRYDRPRTLFYIDPPYYETAGYVHPFPHKDYIGLADILSSIKGRFILSLNDHKKVREIFADFEMKRVTLKYSAGNSRAAAKTRSVERGEVIIKNF